MPPVSFFSEIFKERTRRHRAAYEEGRAVGADGVRDLGLELTIPDPTEDVTQLVLPVAQLFGGECQRLRFGIGQVHKLNARVRECRTGRQHERSGPNVLYVFPGRVASPYSAQDADAISYQDFVRPYLHAEIFKRNV